MSLIQPTNLLTTHNLLTNYVTCSSQNYYI